MAVGPLRQLDQGWTTGTRCCFGGPAPREPLRAGPEQRDVHYTTGSRKGRVSSKEPHGFPEGGIADPRREILLEGMGHFGAPMNTTLPVTSSLHPQSRVRKQFSTR